MRFVFLFLASAALLILASCFGPSEPGPRDIIREDGKVFIVDETGKRWEVTHAEKEYGLKAENFQFGLGPNAIPPIRNPKFYSPGDPSYPVSTETFLVLGTMINGESRAYPIGVMSAHEVAIESFDSTHVTVAY